MVIAVKDALAQRFDAVTVATLETQIDAFLITPDADNQALALDIDPELLTPELRNHLAQLYTDAGWIVVWDTHGRDGPLMRITTNEN